MNRNSAKLLMLTGILCVIISVVLPICNLAVKIDVSPLIAAFCFIAGIILIVFSLAYHTEK